MTQLDLPFQRSSLFRAVDQIALISKPERDLLRVLVRIYWQARELGTGYRADTDGTIVLELRAALIAEQMGVNERTLRRRINAVKQSGRYITIEDRDGRPSRFELDMQAIYSAIRLSGPMLTAETEAGDLDRIAGIEQLEEKIRSGRSAVAPETTPDTPDKSADTPDKSADTPDKSADNPGQKRGHLHHTIDPYHKDHKEPQLKETMGPLVQDGLDGSLKRFSFRDLRRGEFRDPAAIEARYREAVAAGILRDLPLERIAFFALMINLGRSKTLANPAGMLTKLLRGGTDPYGKTWRTRPAGRDDEAAQLMIAKLDREAREREREAVEEDCDEWADTELDAADAPLTAVVAATPSMLSLEVIEQLRAASAIAATRVREKPPDIRPNWKGNANGTS